MAYMNKETGELLMTYEEMNHQFEEMYDGNDPTNPVTWDEYFDKVEAGKETLKLYEQDKSKLVDMFHKEMVITLFPSATDVINFLEKHDLLRVEAVLDYIYGK